MADPRPTPVPGGTAQSHPQKDPLPILVAPTTQVDLNTIRAFLIPVGCWRIDDIRFAFDSSVIHPDAKIETGMLDTLRKAHPGAPLSIFGHADPTGTDDYNKTLSGRRATAVYALLTRDIAKWETLYSKPFGGDNWGIKSIQLMLNEVTGGSLALDGIAGGQTNSAIGNYQQSKGLGQSGSADRPTRAKLFADYMDKVCVDAAGKTFQLQKSDFLAKGADPDGKGDFQGCGEFNPFIVFSKDEAAQYESDHATRDRENAPNRRVMGLLFKPGTVINASRWPCPKASEGKSGCIDRFWKDGETRRNPQAVRRAFDDTKDTYACRFYHRLFVLSPCGAGSQAPVATLEFVLDPTDTYTVGPDNPVATFVRMGLWDHAFTCGTPSTLNDDVTEVKNFIGADSRRFYLRVKDPQAKGSVQVKWRTLKSDSTKLDSPADENITLVETGAGTGIFGSRALMLVSDSDDQHQSANSGLAATFPTAGSRGFGQSDHRIRLGDLEGSVEAEYAPATGAPIKTQLPVFQRDPEKRRKMSIQLFVLRVAAGGNGVIDTSPAGTVWSVDLRVIRETYQRIGIKVDTVVAPGTAAANIVKNGADSLVLIDPPAGVDPLNVSTVSVGGAVNDESRITTLFPGMANTITVFFTGGLKSGNRGESSPDIDWAGKPDDGSCFINGVAGPYSTAHEIGHVLTNKSVTKSGGHYLAPGGDPGKRLCTNQNLMLNGTSVSEGVLESKRLYDEADVDGNVQVTAILGSRFTHGF